MPLPEQSRLELEAIDATLAGEPVDPRHAELAELALLLADSKPELPAARAAELDRRFAALGTASPRRRRTPPARRPWFVRPGFASALAAGLIVAVLVITLPHGGGGSSSSSSSGSSALTKSPSSAGDSAARSLNGLSSSSASGAASSAPAQAVGVPTPQSNGRRTVQAAQLSLSAPSARLGAVAEELFDVVGTERGIVQHSDVTSGSGGYASFSLSIPTQNLSATLARLAQLRSATVLSSSASSTDVNSQYLDDQRKLADAKALRSSLLTQLQAATTTAATDSLKVQIRDAESTITKDEAALAELQSHISYSAVDVQINATAPAASRSGGGFTLRRAAHDALDVLKVVAGVTLVVLAGLIPLSVLAALGVWLSLGWRRRRRERVLDAT